jgi:hypothetical protein
VRPIASIPNHSNNRESETETVFWTYPHRDTRDIASVDDTGHLRDALYFLYPVDFLRPRARSNFLPLERTKGLTWLPGTPGAPKCLFASRDLRGPKQENKFQAVLRIPEILVRIRILLFSPVTFKRQQKNIF